MCSCFNAGLATRSGKVICSNKLVDFLYNLMRDHLPTGIVMRAASQVSEEPVTYTNGWLANMSKDIANQLMSDFKGKTAHQRRVNHMMELAGQKLPKVPTIPDEKTRKLRALLILEEALETIEALGFGLRSLQGTPALEHLKERKDLDALFEVYEKEPDLVGIADGCADISVVTIGTLSACGIEDTDLLELVDCNNLEKFGPGGHKDPVTGKWVKPPGHKPPDIKALLVKQGYIDDSAVPTERWIRPQEVCSS